MKPNCVLTTATSILIAGFICLSITSCVKRSQQYKGCIRPPDPFYKIDGNVKLALDNTISLLEARAGLDVVDVIPPSARTLEMIGFLSCVARQDGLIKDDDKLIEYTRLLGDIASGNVKQSYVSHKGTLSALQSHLDKSQEANFSLNLDAATPNLKQFWVEGIAAKTWQLWFQKMCSKYAACLECEPNGESIKTQITIRGTSKLREVNYEGETFWGCP